MEVIANIFWKRLLCAKTPGLLPRSHSGVGGRECPPLCESHAGHGVPGQRAPSQDGADAPVRVGGRQPALWLAPSPSALPSFQVSLQASHCAAALSPPIPSAHIIASSPSCPLSIPLHLPLPSTHPRIFWRLHHTLAPFHPPG